MQAMRCSRAPLYRIHWNDLATYFVTHSQPCEPLGHLHQACSRDLAGLTTHVMSWNGQQGYRRGYSSVTWQLLWPCQQSGLLCSHVAWASQLVDAPALWYRNGGDHQLVFWHIPQDLPCCWWCSSSVCKPQIVGEYWNLSMLQKQQDFVCIYTASTMAWACNEVSSYNYST